MRFVKEWWRELTVGTLVLSNILVWSLISTTVPTDKLRVYFLDVGQGDAIFIDSPNHSRVLIDGGRNRQLLSRLGEVMPFNDKDIDVVIATHPDADHIGGLPEVVKRFTIGVLLEPGVESDNSIDDELDRVLEDKSVPKLLARRGQVINLGSGVRLEILFPIQDDSNWETNRA